MMKLQNTGVVSMDLTVPTINIREELSRLWYKPDEIKRVFFRVYRKDIRRAFSYLSYKYDFPRVNLERAFLRHGISYLYTLSGITDIRRAKQFVIEHSDNGSDAVHAFENRFFDIGTSSVTIYQGDLLEPDKAQAGNLADILGLSHGIVYQAAFAYTLLKTDIPTPIYHDLGDMFFRFWSCIEQWGIRASRIQRACEQSLGMGRRDYRRPLEEFLPLSVVNVKSTETNHGDCNQSG